MFWSAGLFNDTDYDDNDTGMNAAGSYEQTRALIGVKVVVHPVKTPHEQHLIEGWVLLFALEQRVFP